MPSSKKSSQDFIITILNDAPAYLSDFNPNYNMKSSELYLEMLENKDKVDPKKIDVEYIKNPISLEYNANQNRTSYYNQPNQDTEQNLDQSFDSNSSVYSDTSTSTKRKLEDEDNDLNVTGNDKKIKPNHYSRLMELENDNDKNIKSVEIITEQPTITNNSNNLPEQPLNFTELRQRQQQRENEINSEKQVYIAKFNLLGKQYPSMKLPYVSMSTDLEYMKNEYKTIFKNLRLDQKHQQMRTVLIIIFYGIEFLLGKLGKFDMVGYTDAQLNNMEKYDRLLYELGEKHFKIDAPEQPVEFRLAGAILMNTALFVILKKVTNKMDSTGNSDNSLFGFLGKLLNNFGGGGSKSNVPSPTPQNPPPQSNTISQPKMAGPNIQIN